MKFLSKCTPYTYTVLVFPGSKSIVIALFAKMFKSSTLYRQSRIVMDSHGCGALNDNGERLSNFFLKNRLIIAGTLFPHKTTHKLTWVSPNGKVENQFDHVLVNQKWRRSLFDVRACSGQM